MSEENDSATLKRQVKPTVRAMEDALQRKIQSRKASLTQLTTKKKNEMLHLMDDDGNLEVITTKLVVEFNKLLREFCELNISVKEQFQQVASDEVNSDQEKWYKPKSDSFKSFSDDVDAWIAGVHERMEEARKVNENIKPSDSISEASSKKSKGSKASSGRSSASSARLKAELDRAALLARAATHEKEGSLG